MSIIKILDHLCKSAFNIHHLRAPSEGRKIIKISTCPDHYVYDKNKKNAIKFSKFLLVLDANHTSGRLDKWNVFTLSI